MSAVVGRLSRELCAAAPILNFPRLCRGKGHTSLPPRTSVGEDWDGGSTRQPNHIPALPSASILRSSVFNTLP